VENSGKYQREAMVPFKNANVKTDQIENFNYHFLIGWFLVLITTLIFIALYASSFPLTDEWLFLRNAITLYQNGFDITSLSYHIYNHPVHIPTLIYLIFGYLFQYNSYVFILITVACFSGIIWIIHTRVKMTFWQVFILSTIVLGTGHYMEYMWGNQFHLALSIFFSVAGLAIFDLINQNHKFKNKLFFSFSGLILIICGIFSSAGAIFTFLALICLVALKRIKYKEKIILISISLCLFIGFYFYLTKSGHKSLNLSFLNIYGNLFTAFGGVLVGTPVAIYQFKLNLSGILGISLFCIATISIIYGFLHNKITKIIFPISLIIFSCLCISAIALARNYLGNWHLQFAMPGVAGIFCIGLQLKRELKNKFIKILNILTYLVILFTIFGFIRGFSNYGPNYRNYVVGIEKYAGNFLQNPRQNLPFPSTGGWNLNRDMILFLSVNHHPFFKKENNYHMANAKQQILPSSFYIENKRIRLPITSSESLAWLPLQKRYSLVIAGFVKYRMATNNTIIKIFDKKYVLHKINPDLIEIDINNGLDYFAGFIDNRYLKKSQRVEFLANTH
jgi:hypothetical protein